MTTQTPPPGKAKTALLLLSMFVGSALVTAALAYAALEGEWMPCRSNFEGGCGYGAVMAVAGMSVILFPVLFVGSALLYFRRTKSGAPAQAASAGTASPRAQLLTQWRAAFAVALFVNVLPLPLVFAGFDLSPLWVNVLWGAGMLTLLANAVMAYRVATHALQKPMPIVIAVLSCVVGWVGAAGVFIYLHVTIARPARNRGG
ncbi:hypothetical protein SAMN05428959_102355 [Duganella sp. CF517]|uniref:hypothetical protein n=1 Tax=Duganella sp. CF517 TaxID=1881038 RepID=UPI0008AEE29F|nr:hypothetical protein [Duganella sp. CF517]SEN55086.1 hypothetical protein SAMN05428959_102355 [Duganella sp. CF517]